MQQDNTAVQLLTSWVIMTGCSVLGRRQSVVTVADGNLCVEWHQWVTVTTTGRFVGMQMGQI